MNEEATLGDASLDAKWIAATTGAIASGVYLLDSFIRRVSIAEELNVPQEALGPLIGDRGWAGYSAVDTLCVLAAIVGGWFIPGRDASGLFRLAAVCVVTSYGFGFAIIAARTWVPPAAILASVVLFLVIAASYSAKIALIGGRLALRSAVLAVFAVGIALLLSWISVTRGLFHGNQFEWYIKTRSAVHLLFVDHDSMVQLLGGIDPAADEIRLLGTADGFVYLYWRGLRDLQIDPTRSYDPRQNPRAFAIPQSDVIMFSDTEIRR